MYTTQNISMIYFFFYVRNLYTIFTSEEETAHHCCFICRYSSVLNTSLAVEATLTLAKYHSSFREEPKHVPNYFQNFMKL